MPACPQLVQVEPDRVLEGDLVSCGGCVVDRGGDPGVAVAERVPETGAGNEDLLVADPPPVGVDSLDRCLGGEQHGGAESVIWSAPGARGGPWLSRSTCSEGCTARRGTGRRA